MDQISANTRTLTEKGIEETGRAEHSALTAVNGVRECYLRMLDMAHENTVASFALARELASVQSPLEIAAVWNTRARDAYDTFSDQTKELSKLAQKVATSTMQPSLMNGLTSLFRQA
jgi:hypothetical protein